MRISKDWLLQHIDLPDNITELMCEYSVESTLEANPAYIDSAVVIGQVIDVTQHPNADKLKVTTVKIGDGQTLSIVCGCPTVAVGMVVPVACIGAQLPGGKIKKSKLRQVSSEGMLCSLSDLGLENQSSGLYVLPASAPIGQSFSQYLGVQATLFDIEVTPNRGDCLSVLGIAREVHAVSGNAIKGISCPKIPLIISNQTSECPVFATLKISNIKPQPLPLIMTARLKAAGIQSVHPVVDILNYVMLEMGQPMHAYDGQKLKGSLQTHILKADTTFDALNGEQYSLAIGDLVVSDDERIQAVAGVIGSQYAKIDDHTSCIVIEAAHFNMDQVRSSSSRLRLHTDSSIRFSRFVDPLLPIQALQYAASLLVAHLDAKIEKAIEVNNDQFESPVVNLNTTRLNQTLGTSLSELEVRGLLEKLDIHPIGDGQYKIPSYRSHDLVFEHDLIEEVIRIYGFNRLPRTPLQLQAKADVPLMLNQREQMTQALIAQGYQEIVTYAFTSFTQVQSFAHKADQLIQLANPISTELEYMRQSLLPSLLKVSSEHMRSGQTNIQLMEIGKRYFSDQEIISLGMCHVLEREAEANAFENMSHQLMQVYQHHMSFSQSHENGFHPGVCAKITSHDQCVGVMGQLHPKLSQQMFDKKTVMLCQIDLIFNHQHTQYQAFSRFPKVRRDVAYLVSKTVAYEKIRNIIDNLRIKNLQSFQVFDIYPLKESENVSLALRFVFCSNESNMTEQQVQKQLSKINQSLLDKLGITVR